MRGCLGTTLLHTYRLRFLPSSVAKKMRVTMVLEELKP